MNNSPYNTQTFNAAPSFLPASGLNSPVIFGTVTTTMGAPVNAKFVATNYIKPTFSSTNYVKNKFTSYNYIKGA